MKIASTLKRFSPVRTARAHCDIPCGIYDPIAAKIAAQTVLKMVVRIESLGDDHDVATHNTLSRYVAAKEEHADLCKRELNILGNDYFKPNHLEDHPDLPSKFMAATGLCSQNKQGVSSEAAEALVAAVDEIATIYWATKGVEYSDPVAEVRFGA